MEIKVNEIKIPELISFNYDEIKQELEERVQMYETMVYTDDQIKEAKADKANLNKLKKALNDERIRLEKEYMKPFAAFKEQVAEIISIIDKPVKLIDQQVKAYEETRKELKHKEIRDYWESIQVPEHFEFERIYNEKWLNSSVSMTKIKAEIKEAIEIFNRDMAMLSMLPEYGLEAQTVYIYTLDLDKAIEEVKRLSEQAKLKAELEKAEAEKAELEKAEAEKAEAEKAEKTEAEPVDQPVEQPNFDQHVMEVPEEVEYIPFSDDEYGTVPNFDEVLKTNLVAFTARLTKDQEEELIKFLMEREIEFTVKEIEYE